MPTNEQSEKPIKIREYRVRPPVDDAERHAFQMMQTLFEDRLRAVGAESFAEGRPIILRSEVEREFVQPLAKILRGYSDDGKRLGREEVAALVGDIRATYHPTRHKRERAALDAVLTLIRSGAKASSVELALAK